MELPGLSQKMGPSSTVAGAAIINAVMIEAAACLQTRGIRVPVIASANVGPALFKISKRRWQTGPRGSGYLPCTLRKVDFRDVQRRLKAVNHHGPIAIERESDGPQQTRDIVASRTYLNELIAETYTS